MYCQQCGSKNPEEARFCRECGAHFLNREGADGPKTGRRGNSSDVEVEVHQAGRNSVLESERAPIVYYGRTTAGLPSRLGKMFRPHFVAFLVLAMFAAVFAVFYTPYLLLMPVVYGVAVIIALILYTPIAGAAWNKFELPSSFASVKTIVLNEVGAKTRYQIEVGPKSVVKLFDNNNFFLFTRADNGFPILIGDKGQMMMFIRERLAPNAVFVEVKSGAQVALP